LDRKKWGYHQDGAGQTLENAYQDWCLAQMSKALGKTDDYELFMKRALNYQNLYDPSTGWMRPKTKDGSWLTPFDFLNYDTGWVEGTAAQFTWFVPQDVQGLINLIGGREAFTSKLNNSFEKARSHNFVALKTRDKKETKKNRRVYINYGNQPSMQTAFLFNYSGAPWLTQFWSREIIEKVYSGVSPFSGYSGDEDQGLMGALSVLLKIGLFEMRGGAAIKPIYEIGSPIFDKITIYLDSNYYSGKKFVIETKNNSNKNKYIQSASLNDNQLKKPWFLHDELVKGGNLILEMGEKPNENWGSDVQDAPPSITSSR